MALSRFPFRTSCKTAVCCAFPTCFEPFVRPDNAICDLKYVWQTRIKIKNEGGILWRRLKNLREASSPLWWDTFLLPSMREAEAIKSDKLWEVSNWKTQTTEGGGVRGARKNHYKATGNLLGCALTCWPSLRRRKKRSSTCAPHLDALGACRSNGLVGMAIKDALAI